MSQGGARDPEFVLDGAYGQTIQYSANANFVLFNASESANTNAGHKLKAYLIRQGNLQQGHQQSVRHYLPDTVANTYGHSVGVKRQMKRLLTG